MTKQITAPERAWVESWGTGFAVISCFHERKDAEALLKQIQDEPSPQRGRFRFVGTLPPGITFNEHTGEMRGIPTAAGTYTYQIAVPSSAPSADGGFAASPSHESECPSTVGADPKTFVLGGDGYCLECNREGWEHLCPTERTSV